MKAAIFAALAFLIFFLERGAPQQKVPPLKHDLINLFTGAVNYLFVGAITAALIPIADGFAEENSLGLLRLWKLPRWWHLIVTFLSLDLYLYLWHRLSHRSNFLFRFHAVHHNDPAMNLSTVFRFHLGELGFSFLARLVYAAAVGLSLPWIIVFEMVSNGFICFHHSNIKIPPRFDRLFSFLFISPYAHRYHHSIEKKPGNSNFGVIFNLWDRLFGTWYYAPRSNGRFGLVGIKNETSMKGNLLLPFSRRRP